MEKYKFKLNSKSDSKLLYNAPVVAVLGILTEIAGAYLVNAFCSWVMQLGDGAPSLLLKAIEKYSGVITDLSSLEPKMVTYVIIAAPMIEELVFRVLFFMIFLKFMPFWAANILQAALFGVYHGVFIQGIYAFLIGLVIGAVFYYTKRGAKGSQIAPLIAYIFSLLFHVTVNTAGLYLAPHLPAELSVGVQAAVGLGLSIVIVGAILYGNSNRR